MLYFDYFVYEVICRIDILIEIKDQRNTVLIKRLRISANLRIYGSHDRDLNPRPTPTMASLYQLSYRGIWFINLYARVSVKRPQ